MASPETQFAGAGADNSSVGTRAWNNPGNIVSDDGTFAQTDILLDTDPSHYLVASDFGFSIPADEVINGIVVSVKKSRFDAATIVTDHRARIVKGGVIGSQDKSNATNWPTSLTVFDYGSTSDLWGDTWTYNDINDAGFGFAIAAKIAAFGDVARVDYVSITVYYGLVFKSQMIII